MIVLRNLTLAMEEVTIDDGMTYQILTIGIPAAAQEQDGHSKPMKSKTS
jgi:hypothetical protein